MSKPYPQGTVIEVKRRPRLGTPTEKQNTPESQDTPAFTALIVSQTEYYYCLSEYLVLRIAPNPPINELEYSLPTVQNLITTSAVTSNFETIKGQRVFRELDSLRRQEVEVLRERLNSMLAISADYLNDYPEPLGWVVRVPFPFSDREESKKRPAIVVNTPLDYKLTQRLTVLYCTTNLKATCSTDYILFYPEQAGLQRDCVVRCRAFTLSKKRVKEQIGRVMLEDFAEIQISLRRAFGLPED